MNTKQNLSAWQCDMSYISLCQALQNMEIAEMYCAHPEAEGIRVARIRLQAAETAYQGAESAYIACSCS